MLPMLAVLSLKRFSKLEQENLEQFTYDLPELCQELRSQKTYSFILSASEVQADLLCSPFHCEIPTVPARHFRKIRVNAKIPFKCPDREAAAGVCTVLSRDVSSPGSPRLGVERSKGFKLE